MDDQATVLDIYGLSRSLRPHLGGKVAGWAEAC